MKDIKDTLIKIKNKEIYDIEKKISDLKREISENQTEIQDLQDDISEIKKYIADIDDDVIETLEYQPLQEFIDEVLIDNKVCEGKLYDAINIAKLSKFGTS